VSILIRNALVGKAPQDLYIEDDRIAEIGARQEADIVIDGRGKACLPGLVNGHTHAAMTLLRGYADDMTLRDWLERRIWPREAKFEPEDVYWGTKLACLEMIRSGTTTFNDMYFFMEEAAKAVNDMGLRAVLSYGIIDRFDAKTAEAELKATEGFLRFVRGLRNPRVQPAIGPHNMDTVSEGTLASAKSLAIDEGVKVHFHLAETEGEVEASQARYGKGPVRALDEMGFLGDWLVAAHCVWLDGRGARILGERGVSAIHNPTSNMKLAVGRAFPYSDLRAAGVTIGLGTDGAASNDNLDLFEEIKLACLLQKHDTGDPTVLPAGEAWTLATQGGADALGLPTGRVEEGKLADLILVDLKRAQLVPRHDLTSLLAYAANGSVVDTTICDGQILMREGHVEDETEILEEAQARADALRER
jgi:5-methylthioadenosine/S-adenosylhomocysteine deaminase